MDTVLNSIYRFLNLARLRIRNPRLLSILADAERFQWQTPEQVREIQWRKLREVLTLAYREIPFYQRWFAKAGTQPQEIRTPEQFALLPAVTKEDIRLHFEELKNNSSPYRSYVNHTGGSTGHPLALYQDDYYYDWNDALTVRADRWAGWDFGIRTAVLWGAERDIEILRKSFRARLLTRGLRREMFLNTFNLDEAKLLRFAHQLSRFRPDVIRGYANALCVLATFLEQRGAVWQHPPRALISAAETLTAYQRSAIERAFRARAFNRYASRDVGMIASECPEHTGLHIAADNVFVEFAPLPGSQAPENRAAEVIVTTLNNNTMPLIRYAIGDLAFPPEREACPCGRGLPLMGSVQGRTSDFIVLPDGKLVHGEYFTHLFYGAKGVRQFQVVQDRADALRILMVTDNEFEQDFPGRIEREIREFLGTPVPIRFEFVDRIASTPTGKFRFTVSHVPFGGLLSTQRREDDGATVRPPSEQTDENRHGGQ